MNDAIEEPTLLCPPEQCGNCGTPADLSSSTHTNVENWRCPGCMKKCCNACFKPNYDGDGSTFFCPNPSCKKLLKFP